MTRLPFVSIIIPTYRDWDRLRICLQRLSRQTYPADRIEVLVIDNEVGAASPDVTKFRMGNLTLLSEPQPGSYAARNRGIATARGEVLAFTDSDCIPDPTWIERGVNELIEHPEPARIGGGIDLVFDNELTLSTAEIYEKYCAFPQARYIARRGACVTANMFAWKWVFDRVGYFDTRMLSGGDMEWGRRAEASGYRILYAPSVKVTHPARGSYGDLRKKARRVGSGSYRPTIRGFIRAHVAIILALIPPIGQAVEISRKEGPLREKLLALLVHMDMRMTRAWSRLKAAYTGGRSRT